ncbi:transposase [Streptomyces aureus]|uniref:transposase n=1 Tax=Streptomyces aureus TaxID=193461 RepID=UPI00355C00A6
MAQSQFNLVEIRSEADEFAHRLTAYWQDADRRTAALALVRSIDLDGGKRVSRELERMLREPWRQLLEGDEETEAKTRLPECLTMGLGCGVCPVEQSSGKAQRRRLSRGDNRQVNAALHRIFISASGVTSAPALTTHLRSR